MNAPSTLPDIACGRLSLPEYARNFADAHPPLTAVQAQLEAEAARAAEAAEVRKKYDEVMWHYRELMKKMAPGMGAGTFLEKGVQRRASKLADAMGTSGHGRSRR